MKQTKRIAYIDFLKFIGLSCIILAHVHPPNWIMMIRSFDVPLMVILSAILAQLSYDKSVSKTNSPKIYLTNRFKRLVLPTWIFLTIYFGLYFIKDGEPYSLHYYLASYGLTRYGIGYVWVILIYLFCAFLVPLFHKLGYSLKSVVSVFLIYIVYEIAYIFKLGITFKLIETTFYYIIPYGTLAFIGYNYSKMSAKNKCVILFISFVSFVSSGIYYWVVNGSPQLVQIAKYPPRIYYLGYGVFCSFGLLLLCENIFTEIYDNAIVNYISAHSLWIYLWHILALTMYDFLPLPSVWFIKYFAVYGIAIFATLVVNVTLDRIERKRSFGILRYLRG